MRNEHLYLKMSVGRYVRSLILFVIYFILATLPETVQGQTKEYATVMPSSGRERAGVFLSLPGSYNSTNDNDAGQVMNPLNAGTADSTTFATLNAGMRVVAGTGFYGQSWVQLKFDNSVPANTPTYIRLGDLEKEGGGLDVLGLVTGDILGLITNEIVVPTAYKNATSASDGTTVSASTNILRGQDGFLYAVVTPTEAYNSVRIRLRNADNPLLGLLSIEFSKLQLKVYNAFYYDDLTACSPGLFSDLGKTTGISVNLGDVVKNPSFAIDDNTSSYSQISTGALAVAASAAQNIYFPALSEPTSTLKVRLGIETSTLNLDLLGAYRVRVFNGNTLVQEFPLQSGLVNGLDLLGLLGNNGATTVSFSVTNGAYDRVEIGLNTTVGLNLAASTLRIYDVSRSSENCPEPPPTINPLISPVCANVDIVSADFVDDAAYATDGNFDSYASIRSGTGILLGLGNRSGHLEVSFPSTGVPANKTTYIRIDYDVEVLNALLAGSLGNTVGGLVNGLLLGEHYFDIHLTNAGSNVLQTSSLDNFNNANGQVRIVQDAAGRYYIAIKSNAPFTNLRITDHTSAVVGLLAPDQFLNVYSICYEASEAICDPAFSTSYEGSGITLDLLQLGNNGVENAHYAIDDNDATASKINLGLLSVAGSMSQYIHFNSLSDPQSVFKIKLAIAASETLNVDLLGAYEIIAYNGATEVYRRSLGGGLLNGTDVLGLLGGGQPGTLTFAPGKAFDRIEIRVNGLVGASAFESSVEVYDVKRYGPAGSGCEDPDFVLPPSTPTPFEDPSCEATVVAWGNADYPHLAADGNNESFATLTASSGQLLGIGAYNGFLEYEFPTAIPANKTTYIRIAMEDDLLSRLLSGTLGTLVNTVGGLSLGDHYFSVEAKTAQTGGNTVLTGSSQAAFSDVTGGDLRIVQDNVGRYYIAVTPNAAYSNIRITEHFPALVGTTQDVASMNIYEACFEMGEDVCLPGQFTSFDVAGVNLGALDAAGVINPDHAISANSSDYSEISTGTVAVAAEVSQRIYFNKLSTAGDTLKVRLQMDPASLASVDLLGRYRIVTYNGSEVAETFTLQQGLINNLNLLNLFSSGGIQTLTYHTDVPYDRVDVVVGSVVNVALTPSIRLYEVKRIGADCPSTTVPSPFENPVCVTTLVAASNADNIDNLFDDDFDSYATLRSGSNSLLGQLLGGQPNQYTGFVELGFETPVDANKTAYVRIDFEPTLLNELLGGSLGGTLAGLVDNLLLGNHYFSIQVKNGNTIVLEGATNNNFGDNNDRIRIVQDALGRYYIAVTPSQQFDAIRITDHTRTGLPLTAQGNSMNVYGACVDNPLTDCQPVFTTSYDATGLTLDAAGLSGSGVKDASHAIDINTTNYSEISLGTVAVGSAVKQIFDFRKLAQPGEVVNLRLQYGEGALDANLIGGLEIVAYNGVTPVATLDVQSALINGLNVLDILNNGSIGIIPFAPEVEFDRVSVGLRGVVGVSVLPALRVYAVEKDCDTPIFEAWKSFEVDGNPAITSVKGGEEVEYTIHIQNTGMVDLENYIVTDEVPDNTTYVSGSGGTLDNGMVTFTGINVAVGATTTVSFKVSINADLTDVNTISNVAFVKLDAADPGKGTVPPADPNDPTAGPDPDATPGTTTDIPVDPIHSVVSWKAYTVDGDATATSVSGGETIVYSIFVRNTGNQELTNVEVSDLLPPGVSYVSGDTLSGNTVSFTIPTLAVGATSAAQVFTVEVNDNLNNISVIRNVAVVSGGDLPPTDSYPPLDNETPTDPDDTGDTGTDIPVVPTDDIVAWKGYSIANGTTTTSVSGGEEINYTIYIRNESNQNLTGLSVSDAIPTGTTFVSTGNGGILNGTTVEFTGINIDFGQTASLSFVVTVNENLTGIPAVSNVAFVKKDATDPDPGQGTVPPADPTNPSNGPDPTATPGTPTDIPVDAINSIDLSLSGVSGGTNSGQAAPGDVITYTVTITNDGNQDLTNVLLVDAIPADTQLDDEGNFALNGDGDLELTIPTLAVGDTETYTFTVTVDPIDPSSVTSIENSVTASNTEVNETANHSMPTACDPVVAADLTLTPSSPTLCLGESMRLTAGSGIAGLNGTMIKWYSGYNAGTGAVSGYLGDGSVPLTVTPTQAGTVRYYAVVEAPGFCFNNPPASVTVTVNALPATPSITASAANVCEGEGFTLTATPGADSYQWSKDGNVLTGEISNILTIAAATAGDAGQYTVVAENTAGCSSAVSTAVTVGVAPRATATDITVTGNDPICGGSAVTLLASTTLTVSNPVFKWYDSNTATTPVFTGSTLNFIPNATVTYYVSLSGDGLCENIVAERAEVTVIVNPAPTIVFNEPSSYTVEINESVPVPAYTAESGVTYQWKDSGGTDFNGTAFGPFASPGTYIYTLIATNTASGCQTASNVTIQVFNAGECPPVYNRVYATDASQYDVTKLLVVELGSVTNPSQAADQNVATSSTLTEVANVLGLLGQTYQNVKWTAPVPAGTPVTIKLGKTLTVAQLVGGVRVQPVDAAGNSVGVAQLVDGDLANIVAGENIFDFTFTPTNAGGTPVAYSGVKISLTALATVAQSVNLYEVYYNVLGTPDCTQPNGVVDVLHGIERPIGGVGVLNGLVNVTDAEKAVDADEATYATLNNAVGVNAYTRLEVLYNTPALAGDTLTIRVGKPATLLTVGLLEAFTIQPYLGNTAVGTPIHNDAALLNISLLPGGTQADVKFIANAPFDRVKILYGGVASVLDQLQVYNIKRTIPTVVAGLNGNNKFEVCPGGDISFTAPDNCTAYEIYNAATDGTIVDVTTLAAGTYTLYVQAIRFGTCATGDRTPIEVTVNEAPVAPMVTDRIVCQTASSATVTYDVAVLPGHTLVYYADATTTTVLATAPTANSQTVGTTTVYVAQINTTTGCESPRVAVSIIVNKTAIASDINTVDATICAGESFTLSATSTTVANPVFRFYTNPALTNEVTDLNVSPASTITYYVTVSGDGVCENAPGTAATLTVTVNSLATASDIMTGDATICAGESFTLSATSTTVTNPVFRFYTNPALTNEVTNLNVSPAATTTYYVTVSGDGVCENALGTAATLTVTVNPLATASDITVADAEICAGDDFTLTATSTTVTNPVFRFYTNPALTNEVTNLNVSPAATTTYYVTAKGDGVCENAPGTAATLTVTVNPLAMASDITTVDATICAGESFTLSATSATVTNPVFRFYTNPALTNEVTNLNVSPAATTTYYVTVSGDGVCENAPGTAATLTVTVNPLATASDITTVDATICAGDTFTLTATSATVTNPVFRFYTDAALTNEVTNLNVSPAVTTTYYVTVSGDGVCENAPNTAANLTVKVNPLATASDITTVDATICAGDTFTLTATSATVTNPVFRFYTDPALTNELTDLNVSPAITTTYYVTVSGDGVCENAPNTAATLTIIVTPRAAAPTIDDAAPDYCVHEGMTLADLPVVGTGIKWYDSAVGGTLLPSTTVMQDGVTYYATQTADNTCESVNRLAVTPTITDCLAILSVEKLADQERVVAGTNTSFTLVITNDGPGIVNAGEQIIVKEEPSAGLTITGFSIEEQVGTVTYDENTATATVTVTNAIPAGGTVSVKVLATVDADAPANIRNKVLVWGPDTPPTDNPDDEDETPPIPVDREYNLTIDKVADEARVKAGEPTTFTVTITNNGPSVMEIGKAIALLERPGEGVTIDGYTVTSDNATVVGTANNATVTTTAKLEVNGAITLRIDATVDEDTPDEITNGITVWGPEKDPEDDPKDDDSDTPPIPVDFPLIEAHDDVEEVKQGKQVTINVLINDIATKWAIDPSTVEITEQPGHGTVNVLHTGEVVYTGPKDYLGNVQFKYIVRDEKGRASNEATVTVTVLENPLEIPNVITPNNDGFNDRFEIRGLEMYDRVQLTIMNRWGNEVYRNRAYNNEWSGTGLNEGTYFYILEFVRGTTVTRYTGSILIKRN